jgi:hypothetical protein
MKKQKRLVDEHFPKDQVVRIQAKELYLRGWKIGDISKKLSLESHVISNWKSREQWEGTRDLLRREIAKEQLIRIKKDAAQIYNEMDRSYVGLTVRILKEIEGKNMDNELIHEPLQLSDAEAAYGLLIRLLADRRSLLNDALGSMSESLPLIDPVTLDLVRMKPRDRVDPTPTPEEAAPPPPPPPGTPPITPTPMPTKEEPLSGDEAAREILKRTGNLLVFERSGESGNDEI